MNSKVSPKKMCLMIMLAFLIILYRHANADFTFGTPTNLGPTVNSSAFDDAASISTDGSTLFFMSGRPGGYGINDLWVSMRATIEDDWGTPVNLGPTVNTSFDDFCPGISADGLSLYFTSNRPGGYGNRPGGYGLCSLWVTTRATTEDDWGTPVNLGPTVNSSNGEKMPYISPDCLTLYFGSNRPSGLGNGDLWQVSIEPVVDLNGDGIVDSTDLCIIVNHWGEDYPWCDIGPTPLGDGIVDVQDLIVLAEHLFEDVNDPKLLAHWALDETEGIIAHDSSGYNDAYIFGDPTWQPTDGIVNGALQLDGIDDCVLTGAVPNPAEGPFSIFVWIKGGSAGQVVISQLGGGVNWLLADPVEGNLMTELTSPGLSGSPMLSQTNITDGEWHRVGFVWDGSIRTLYVDGLAVAEDTQDGLEGSYSGMYIGTGKAMESGTYWSGLIDDIRIYNRAVIP